MENTTMGFFPHVAILLIAIFIRFGDATEVTTAKNCDFNCPINVRYSPYCFGSCTEREEFGSPCAFREKRCNDTEKYADFKQIGREDESCKDIPPTDAERCCQACPQYIFPSCYGNGRKQQTFGNPCFFDTAQGCNPRKYRGFKKLYTGSCVTSCKKNTCPNTKGEEVCAVDDYGTYHTFESGCFFAYAVRCQDCSGYVKVYDGPCSDGYQYYN